MNGCERFKSELKLWIKSEITPEFIEQNGAKNALYKIMQRIVEMEKDDESIFENLVLPTIESIHPESQPEGSVTHDKRCDTCADGDGLCESAPTA